MERVILDVTFSVHWKQGDDLANCIKEANGNPIAGLRLWADEMDSRAKHIRDLASALEGKKVEINGGTHYIGIYGLTDAEARRLEKAGLLDVNEIEDEDDDGDDNGPNGAEAKGE
jgi:hypothetical protein